MSTIPVLRTGGVAQAVEHLLCKCPVLRRLKQEDHKFKASLGYTAKYCLLKK
jgi:hypothetical protein